jgi:acetylornithine deacetylase/succinyl-diaminopimelate desuccinylase-like protein
MTVHEVPSTPRQTFNAIGYLPGTDPQAGTLLLSAHLDHLGIGRPVNGDSIYNGANDDAAGTTAVMELAHALAAGPPLRRSVLFVCYGSEEMGTLGSTYFGHHSPVPLKDLACIIRERHATEGFGRQRIAEEEDGSVKLMRGTWLQALQAHTIEVATILGRGFALCSFGSGENGNSSGERS